MMVPHCDQTLISTGTPTASIIPEEEGSLAPVAIPEDLIGTVDIAESASSQPPPVIRYISYI